MDVQELPAWPILPTPSTSKANWKLPHRHLKARRMNRPQREVRKSLDDRPRDGKRPGCLGRTPHEGRTAPYKPAATSHFAVCPSSPSSSYPSRRRFKVCALFQRRAVRRCRFATA